MVRSKNMSRMQSRITWSVTFSWVAISTISNWDKIDRTLPRWGEFISWFFGGLYSVWVLSNLLLWIIDGRRKDIELGTIREVKERQKKVREKRKYVNKETTVSQLNKLIKKYEHEKQKVKGE